MSRSTWPTSKGLPDDFDSSRYLELNPDVAAAGVNASDHYLAFGKDEGRLYRLAATERASDQFTSEIPSDRNAVEIFAGEWSSKIPGFESGPSDLFDDSRIKWINEVFQIAGKTVLELGPLEGAHSYMMDAYGAKSVVAIEGNKRAFFRCLIVKNIFDLKQVKFKFGDFRKYVEQATDRYDIIVACGVLYHMADPLTLLLNLVKMSNRIFVWTHVYDEAIIRARPDRHLFSPLETHRHGGHSYKVSKKLYASAAIEWSGFSGGADTYATWLSRQSLEAFFWNAGFETSVNFEHLTHPNGPAIALCAWRKT